MTKHIKILDYALSSLLRRKYKSLSIVVAYTVTVATLTSVLLLTHALKTETAFILQGVPDLIVQRTIGGRQDLIPIDYIDAIKKIRGVARVTPRYWGYYYDGLTEANYTLIGTGGDQNSLELLTGRLPVEPTECAVGAGVSNLRGAAESEELILVDSRNTGILFKVSGVFTSESNLLTNDLVVLTDQAIVDFFGFPTGMATDVVVDVPNTSETQTVAAKIKQLFPDTRPITHRELRRTYDMVFNWRSGMMLTVFCSAIVAFCILAWDKATGISAAEKQEIGILKAIGWDTSDVLALKFWEGLIISLTSFLTGTILAFIHIFFFDGILLAAVIKGWSVLFPPFKLTPGFSMFQLLIVGFFTVVPYVSSTLIPAWKTAITDPETVMRG